MTAAASSAASVQGWHSTFDHEFHRARETHHAPPVSADLDRALPVCTARSLSRRLRLRPVRRLQSVCARLQIVVGGKKDAKAHIFAGMRVCMWPRRRTVVHGAERVSLLATLRQRVCEEEALQDRWRGKSGKCTEVRGDHGAGRTLRLCPLLWRMLVEPPLRPPLPHRPLKTGQSIRFSEVRVAYQPIEFTACRRGLGGTRRQAVFFYVS